MISPFVYPGLKQTRTDKDYIASLVCEYFKINRETFEKKQKDRSGFLVMARKYYCLIQRIFLENTLKESGKIFGYDHATVLYHVNRMIDEFRIYKNEYKEFKLFIGSINVDWSEKLERIILKQTI